jgi:hypothetical protein
MQGFLLTEKFGVVPVGLLSVRHTIVKFGTTGGELTFQDSFTPSDHACL